MGCGCNYSGGGYNNATGDDSTERVNRSSARPVHDHGILGKTEGMDNINRGRAGIPWETGLGDTTGGRASIPGLLWPRGEASSRAGIPSGPIPADWRGRASIPGPYRPADMRSASSPAGFLTGDRPRSMSMRPPAPWIGGFRGKAMLPPAPVGGGGWNVDERDGEMMGFDGGSLARQIMGGAGELTGGKKVGGRCKVRIRTGYSKFTCRGRYDQSGKCVPCDSADVPRIQSDGPGRGGSSIPYVFGWRGGRPSEGMMGVRNVQTGRSSIPYVFGWRGGRPSGGFRNASGDSARAVPFNRPRPGWGKTAEGGRAVPFNRPRPGWGKTAEPQGRAVPFNRPGLGWGKTAEPQGRAVPFNRPRPGWGRTADSDVQFKGSIRNTEDDGFDG